MSKDLLQKPKNVLFRHRAVPAGRQEEASGRRGDLITSRDCFAPLAMTFIKRFGNKSNNNLLKRLISFILVSLLVGFSSSCTLLYVPRIRRYMKEIKPIRKTIEKCVDDMDYLSTARSPEDLEEALNKLKEEWATVKAGLKDIRQAKKKFKKIKPFSQVKKVHNDVETILLASEEAYEVTDNEYQYDFDLLTIIKKYTDQLEALSNKQASSTEEYKSLVRQMKDLMVQYKQEVEKLKPPEGMKELHQAFVSMLDEALKLYERMDVAATTGDVLAMKAITEELKKKEGSWTTKKEEIDKNLEKEADKFNNTLRKLRKEKARIDKKFTVVETKYGVSEE